MDRELTVNLPERVALFLDQQADAVDVDLVQGALKLLSEELAYVAPILRILEQIRTGIE